MFFIFSIIKSIFKISRFINIRLGLVIKVFFLFLISCLEVVGIALIIPILLAFFEQQTLLTIIQKFVHLEFQNLLSLVIFFLLIFFLLKSLLITFINRHILNFVFSFQSKLSKELFDKYINYNYQRFTNLNSSKIIRNIATESRMFAFILINLFQLYSDLIFLSLIFIFLFFINFKVMIYLAFLSTILISIFYFIFKRKLKKVSKLKVENEFKFMKIIKEAFENFKFIKIDMKENFFLKKFSNSSDSNSLYVFQQTYINSLPRVWIEFIVVLIVLFGLIIFQIKHINLSIEILLLLGVYGAAFLKILPSLNRIIYSSQFLINNSAASFLIESELKNSKHLKDLDIHNPENNKIKFNDSIKLKNVSFRYPSNENYVLKNINLEIKKNSILGILGKSGQGKTTLIDLICGLLSPSSGTIEVDGKNITSNITDWKKKISYTSQLTTVIDDDIEKNIAFGIDDNEINYEKIKTSLKKVDLDYFVEKQLEKNTKINESGANISGGQLQRLGLARGYYKDTEILILDEPTSALDKDTSNLIMNNILKFKHKKTIIIISHDQNIISNCENKYEIKNSTLKIID